jgi:hypothetical protein
MLPGKSLLLGFLATLCKIKFLVAGLIIFALLRDKILYIKNNNQLKSSLLH